jgi:DNA-binding NarL/FixJ family response regulator
MLYGRHPECLLLDGLVAAARTGTSAAVVLRGEAGIGKTAMLDHVRQQAGDMLVLSATGVEAEVELPFAGLHQLLMPVMPLTHAVPEPQASALRGALGVSAAHGHDRFLVAAAVLSLLGEAARERGVVCLVDDAQWIDRPSMDALRFATHRLSTEGALVVMAARRGGRQPSAPGLHVLDLSGLRPADATALLGDHSPSSPDEDVGARLAEATEGNPLALVELAAALRPEHLSGTVPLPDPLPLTEGLERAFLADVRRLSPPGQLLLLVAALDTTGRLETLLAASALLGIDEDVVQEVEASALLVVEQDVVRLRHPLIRSAVVAGASSTQRRRTHAMLARALIGDPDRAAWHRSATTLGVDDAVATELEEAAVRASGRSAHAVAAAAYERSARLTSDGEERGRRLLGSAREAWLGAQPDRAMAAAEAARSLVRDPVLAAQVAQARGLFAWGRGVVTEAASILLDGAVAAAASSPGLALTMLVHAGQAAGYGGDMATVREAGEVARGIDPGPDPDAVLARDLATGFADMLGGEAEAGAARLREAVDRAGTLQDPAQQVLAASAAFWLGDPQSAARLAGRAVRTARVADMTGTLPHALEYLSLAEFMVGSYGPAAAAAAEGLDLARETSQLSSVAQHLATLALVAAVRGDVAECRRTAAECLRLAVPRRLLVAAFYAWHAEALCDLFQGRYDQAMQRLVTLRDVPTFDWYAVPDLVEAAHRSGQAAVARDATAWMEPWVTQASSSDAHALLLRCRALLADDADADALFRQALAAHPDGMSLERARTSLLHGEWLRRARRRAEARAPLRAALDTFQELGARPLAERARTELRAAGESTDDAASGDGDNADLDVLTAQELQVALLVTAGASNRDVAARMFISPRTVEYHLYKIFPKLGIASRTELAHRLSGPAAR